MAATQNTTATTIEQTLLCPDCGLPMHEETYIRRWGNYSTFTCKTENCTLKEAITETAEKWASLTPDQLEGYRKIAAARKVTHAAFEAKAARA